MLKNKEITQSEEHGSEPDMTRDRFWNYQMGS